MLKKLVLNQGVNMECCSSLIFLGRLLISAIFILSGIGKFMEPEATEAYMAAKGMSMVPFFLYAAAIVEILGGLSILIGFKARWGGLLLFLYLIPVTLIFHSFWTETTPDAQKLQMIMFMKNLTILGALLYVMGAGAGKWSIDKLCDTGCCKK